MKTIMRCIILINLVMLYKGCKTDIFYIDIHNNADYYIYFHVALYPDATYPEQQYLQIKRHGL